MEEIKKLQDQYLAVTLSIVSQYGETGKDYINLLNQVTTEGRKLLFALFDEIELNKSKENFDFLMTTEFYPKFLDLLNKYRR